MLAERAGRRRAGRRRWRCASSPTATPQLHFALLTDFRDAAEATQPADDACWCSRRAAGIERLNRKLPRRGRRRRDRFFLLHRPRRWNAREGVLDGLRAQARQAGRPQRAAARRRRATASRASSATCALLAGVRYVITLDTDTQLPRDAARQFVGDHGASAEPPASSTRQTRAGSSRATASCSRASASACRRAPLAFARLFGGDAGIDPYTRAVSDVYQDLFGEGSFIGKGIYDVDAFEHVLARPLAREPRSSATTCSKAATRAPACSATSSCSRTPRRATTPTSSGATAGSAATGRSPAGCCRAALRRRVDGVERRHGPQPAVARCRAGRSSTTCAAAWCPAALTLLLLLGWTVLAAAAGRGRSAALAVLFVPALLGLLGDAAAQAATSCTLASTWRPSCRPGAPAGRRPRCCWRLPALRGAASASTRSRARCGGMRCRAAACSNGSRRPTAPRTQPRRGCATSRRRWRAWRRRPLLALADARRRCRMAAGGAAGRRAGAAALVRRAGAGLVAEPAAAAPPVHAQRRPDGLPAAAGAPHLAFFETYVGADDNCLPPDNIQEHPVARVAHRTSPTNIGLSLLAPWRRATSATSRDGQMIARTDGHARHAGAARAVPRPLPELVRHPHAAAAAPGLRLHRGQRQPRRPPADAARRPAAAGRRGAADRSRLLHGLRDTLDLLREARRRRATAPLAQRLAALLDAQLARPPAQPSSRLRGAATRSRSPARRGTDAAGAACRQTPTVERARPSRSAGGRALSEPVRRRAGARCAALSSGAGRRLERRGARRARRDALRRLAERAGALASADHALPLRPDARPARDRLQRRRAASTPATTTCWPPRRGWRASSPSRKRQVAAGALVRARPAARDAATASAVLLSWSGSMFEYLMPCWSCPPTRTRCSTRPARRGRAPDPVRPQRGVPWGISESGYNADRRRLQLPVPRLRRARSRPQARAGRRPGRGAVRHGAGADGRPARRRAEPAAPRRRGAGRHLRLLRSDRLHARAPAARRKPAPSCARTWRTTRA